MEKKGRISSSRLHALVKVKLSNYKPGQCPWCSKKLRLTEFLDSLHMKMVRLSALHTGWLLPQEKSMILICVSWPQGHGAAASIKSIKNPNDPIGNWTCDLPLCSRVPQPTASPLNPLRILITEYKFSVEFKLLCK